MTISLNDLIFRVKSKPRPIYDILNVLEGIGYLERDNNKVIRWTNKTDIDKRDSGQNLIDIAEMEKNIEWHNLFANKQDYYIYKTTSHIENLVNCKDLYITKKDIQKLQQDNSDFRELSFFVVDLPKGSEFEYNIYNNDNDNIGSDNFENSNDGSLSFNPLKMISPLDSTANQNPQYNYEAIFSSDKTDIGVYLIN